MAPLENKVTIVTGAGSGIEKTVALMFAREGARVKLSDINDLIPLDDWGESDEALELTLWLASSKSSFVSNLYYAVDGEYLAQ